MASQQPLSTATTKKDSDRVVSLYCLCCIHLSVIYFVHSSYHVWSITNGYARIEKNFFDTYNESECLIAVVERYKERMGVYPERVLAYKIYRNRTNLSYCKDLGIRLSAPALGRPKKDQKVEKNRIHRQPRSSSGRKRLQPGEKKIRAEAYTNMP